MADFSNDNPFVRKHNQMRDRLNAVSPSFCLAKWKQVTIHLHNGFTHSCHHPTAHKIPLSGLKDDPSILHNTPAKKEARREMLEGKRPQECNYCWNIEDSGQSFSDRHLKSAEVWAEPHFEQIRQAPWDANTNPSYVEVSFSTQCNFRCSYCSPQVSSYWMKEVRDLGPYKLKDRRHQSLEYMRWHGLVPIEDEDKNPYIQAFWQWWPDLVKDLKIFRITGGEPLLSPNTFKVLEWLRDNPQPQLSLAVNSNLGVPTPRLERFLGLIKDLKGKIKDFHFFTSADTAGLQAEYIRNGLNYEKWLANMAYSLETVPEMELTIMCTYNALSVPNFPKFLSDIRDLRARFATAHRMRVLLDIAYLRYPEWQSVQILTPEFFALMKEQAQYMEQFRATGGVRDGFRDIEIEKMRRLADWAPTMKDTAFLNLHRKNFHLFFSQHDSRRKTDFLATFPEMQKFWQSCAKL